MNQRTIPLLISRLVLAWVFISAGLPKVQDPVAFSTSIEGYRLISGSPALWTAIILPWLELIIGFGLLTPWLRRASACIMVALLCLFITLHGSAWTRGLDINCGCFGKSTDSPEYHWLILRNLVLLIITIFILRASCRNKRTPKSSN
ncbi:MauE/DoxX family redox-associated membrane protein [Coraliomargarita sinensis]|uniref:MauE/DoxX family redox-associated membrane protein n=1 Tax=Coraliomargarita sinensis TaxID=2174842 RepID=UPI001304C3C1|nr:MauE/DoxX family redox-associated membrane protein [Coraliomargarita sinensis]